jgi:hypothetical protein
MIRAKEEKESKDQYFCLRNTVFRTEPAIIPWNRLYSHGPALECGVILSKYCSNNIAFIVERRIAIKYALA